MLWTSVYTNTNTNNINETWALLQTTGGKDEPNIVLFGNRCPKHIALCLFFFVVLYLAYPMLPVSLDCSLLISPSVFSNVYHRFMRKSQWTWQHGTKNAKMHNRTTQIRYATRTQHKTGSELRCSWRVNSSYFLMGKTDRRFGFIKLCFLLYLMFICRC
jgi:hypothetical protein